MIRGTIPVAHFARLAQVAGVQLISLQQGPNTDQLAAWPGQNVPITLGNCFDETSGPFMDTAAIEKRGLQPVKPDIDRIEAIADKGGDPFAQIQLPAAAIALKQGFGRLIRRRDDRGIVAILDSRIVTKSYGRVFVETLPAGLPRTSSLEQVRRWYARS